MDEKKSVMQNFKESFTNKKFKQGIYSSTITTIVVVAILIVNLIVSTLDLKVDISQQQYYTLTKSTKQVVKGVKDNIKIYYISEQNKEIKLMKRIVNKYNNLSDNVEVITKDPVLYPKFTSQYVDNDTKVNDNSIIVVNETNGRSKYIAYGDMIVQEMNYQTFQDSPVGIDVEGQLTSAIQYVVTENLPVLYAVQGHGELEVSGTLANYLGKQNVSNKTLDTISAKEIPGDCSVLLINGPTHDFTKEETSMIMSYLKTGGKAIILGNFEAQSDKMPNFNSILSYYGISFVDSYVIDADSNHYMAQAPTYLVPDIEKHAITKDVTSNKMNVVVPATKGIRISDDVRSTVTVEELLNTSDKAYAKTNIQSQALEKEEGDVDGPFSLGVAISEKTSSDETKLVVYASNYLLDEQIISYDQFGNAKIFLSTINWMANANVQTLAIPERSIKDQHITITSSQANTWSFVVVFLIPAIFIVTGIIVCVRRRKK